LVRRWIGIKMSELISVDSSADVSQGKLNNKNPGNPSKILFEFLLVGSLH
jgi:hypothetical protein